MSYKRKEERRSQKSDNYAKPISRKYYGKKARKKKKQEILQNKKLLKRFPWLRIRDWQGKPVKGYSYTWLDDIPNGWKKAFGLLLCEDIDAELRRSHFRDEYRIVQIKEKFGTLRWYDNGWPVGSAIPEIINKYEYITGYTCIICGKPGKMVITGWYSPYCRNCYEKYYDGIYKENTDNTPFSDNLKTTVYSSTGKIEKEYDLSGILVRMQPRYRQPC